MITAKNYAAQAERGLTEALKKLDQDLFRVDIGLIDMFVSTIKKAVHFAVPDGGAILDDNFKGLSGIDVRLPFPIITVEYFVDGLKGRETDIHCPKRLVIATEVDEAFVNARVKSDIKSEKWILVYAACTRADFGWIPSLVAWAMPCAWEQKINSPVIGRKEESHRPVLTGVPLFLPEFFKQACAKYGEKEAIENMLRDISMEVAAVMELCEALSCSNVMHEPIEEVNPAVNVRRIRCGKLPIYETRRLVINAISTAAASGKLIGASHVSPRQHLRRGHIRRLPDKNIWVNSCVVGDKANGVIEKQYAVQR